MCYTGVTQCSAPTDWPRSAPVDGSDDRARASYDLRTGETRLVVTLDGLPSALAVVR